MVMVVSGHSTDAGAADSLDHDHLRRRFAADLTQTGLTKIHFAGQTVVANADSSENGSLAFPNLGLNHSVQRHQKVARCGQGIRIAFY